MTTLLDVPWSNFCAFVKVKINQKNAKQTNAKTQRRRWERERRKRCSTQRANDKFSLAFWQLVLAGFCWFFLFWLLVIFGLVCLLFLFWFFLFRFRCERLKKKCFMHRPSKANEQCDTDCRQNAHALARLGCFLAGSQPRFDDSVLKITGRGNTYQNVKCIKCKFYATFKIAGAMFCNLSTTARISKRVDGGVASRRVTVLRRNCCNDNTATSTTQWQQQKQQQDKRNANADISWHFSK